MSFKKKAPLSDHSNARLHFDPDAPLLTQQSDKDKCDLKNILMSLVRSGTPLNATLPEGIEFDTTALPDFMSAQKVIADAKSIWESIPARIRADFNHSQVEFLDFISNADNRDKIADYGFSTSHLPEVSPDPATSEPLPAPTSTAESEEA